jgi:uncharacterized protein YjbI with pentapeptide repeats
MAGVPRRPRPGPRKPAALIAPDLTGPRRAADVTELTGDGDWSGLDLWGEAPGARLHGIDLAGSTGARLSLVAARFDDARLTDVAFEGCDLSGVQLAATILRRVEFRHCRLSGAVLADAQLNDVRFSGCRADDLYLNGAVGECVWFEACELQGSEWKDVRVADLRLHDCDLSGADLAGADLTGARLHGSTLAGVKHGERLRGAVIDGGQLMPVALALFDALGIVVDDDRQLPD